MNKTEIDYQYLFSNAIGAMFNSYASDINMAISPDYGRHNRNRFWKCIHFDEIRFVNLLQEVKDIFVNERKMYDRPKFLDVGCGVGQKVFLAGILGFNAYGLEYSGLLADAAKKLLNEYDIGQDECQRKENNKKRRIFRGNALNYKKYADYDVIYFYRPIAVDNLYEQMELRIMEYAKKGAIALPVYHSLAFESPSALKEYGWKQRPNSKIYEKVK